MGERAGPTDHLQFCERFYAYTHLCAFFWAEDPQLSSDSHRGMWPRKAQSTAWSLLQLHFSKYARTGDAPNLELTCILEHLCFQSWKCLFTEYSSHEEGGGGLVETQSFESLCPWTVSPAIYSKSGVIKCKIELKSGHTLLIKVFFKSFWSLNQIFTIHLVWWMSKKKRN